MPSLRQTSFAPCSVAPRLSIGRLRTSSRLCLLTKHTHTHACMLCLLLTARNVRAGQVFCGEVHPLGGEGGWKAKEQARRHSLRLRGRSAQGTPREGAAANAAKGCPKRALCALCGHMRCRTAPPSGWSECMHAADVSRLQYAQQFLKFDVLCRASVVLVPCPYETDRFRGCQYASHGTVSPLTPRRAAAVPC